MLHVRNQIKSAATFLEIAQREFRAGRALAAREAQEEARRAIEEARQSLDDLSPEKKALVAAELSTLQSAVSQFYPPTQPQTVPDRCK